MLLIDFHLGVLWFVETPAVLEMDCRTHEWSVCLSLFACSLWSNSNQSIINERDI